MPSTLTYPGVYIEEVPSGVRTIIGVPTGICAFVGRAQRGPVDDPRTINGFGDFERLYGGLWPDSRLGFSVRDFFGNGGGQAIVVRVFNAAGLLTNDTDAAVVNDAIDAIKTAATNAATPGDATTEVGKVAAPNGASDAAKALVEAQKQIVLDAAAAGGATTDDVKKAAGALEVAWSRMRLDVGGLTLAAKDPGRWATSLRGRIDTVVHKGVGKDIGVPGDDDSKVFNLTITDVGSGRSEQFLNVTLGTTSTRPLPDVIRERSSLVTVVGTGGTAPDPKADPQKDGKSGYDDAVKAVTDKLVSGDQGDAEVKALRDKLTPFSDPIGANEQVLAALQKAGADAMRATTDTTKTTDALKAAVTAAQTALTDAKAKAEASVGDGDELDHDSFVGEGMEAAKTGLYALRKADLFNLLVIPPYTGTGDDLDVEVSLIGDAAKLCEDERALLIVDPPSDWIDKDAAKAGIGADPDVVGTRSKNAAIFFPRIRQPNPLHEMRTELFTPSGVVAGVMARTDRERGVWKAPAGLDATLNGVPELAVKLTADENGELNPLGVNCLRSVPPGLRVVWGSRTLQGDDRFASEWKYIPIRRLALFIEESLFRGTQWVVFEPNDEPLWASIRLNVGAFMNGLFRQGAFQGRTPQEAYFVKCDKDTNPQEDIDRGIVNILVGFAPLKPAEFVVIKLQQIAGQLQA